MYTKTMASAKKILIESETTETFRLSVSGPATITGHCEACCAIDEMLDLNAAADISGVSARELIRLLELGEIHSPETQNGHLLVCRGSLEAAINRGDRFGPRPLLLKKSYKTETGSQS